VHVPSRCTQQFATVVWFTFCSAFLLLGPLSTVFAAADDDEAYAQAMMQPLNSMLNWGVANSDPEHLKRIADMVTSRIIACPPISRVVINAIGLLIVAVQVRDGTAQPSNFDANVLNTLFPTPLIDMRALNADACNASLGIAVRLQALEVLPAASIAMLIGIYISPPVTAAVCRVSKN
jgi:hypothetical protein